MKVTAAHWIDTAIKEPIAGGSEMKIRRCVVTHFTAGATAKSSINYWRSLTSGICAHLVIDRDGTIYQCRPFNRTCGHAGVSRWKDPKTGILYKNANGYSIGIEIANAGDNEALAKKWSKLPLLTAKHRNGGPVRKWENYTPEQISAVKSLCQTLVARYNLDDVTGHDCIAPERKNDPGPAFPIQDIRKACGFSGLPIVHWKT